MRVWVDADACPAPIRDIILRACLRKKIAVFFIANKPLVLPPSQFVVSVQVDLGADVADAYILEHASAGDLVITQDIPLAAALVKLNVDAISPRGTKFDSSNINDILASRNLLQELRDTGSITGGPRPFDDKDKHRFASQFDAALHRLSS